MATAQAVPKTYTSTVRPSTGSTPSIVPGSSFAERYLSFAYSSFLDGAYYVTLLTSFLYTTHKNTWGSIACLSFSEKSMQWDADWRSPDPDESRLCILRGCVSPVHISELAYTFHLNPAFLVGHLGTTIARTSAGTWPTYPPLPSQRNGMGHIRFLILGCDTGPTDRYDFSRMPQRRRACGDSRERHDWGLQSQHQFGETRVRDVHMHNPRYFSVEQLVSFCFVRDDQSGRWDGVLLTDNGRSLAHRYDLPWKDYLHRSNACFMPRSTVGPNNSTQKQGAVQLPLQEAVSDFYTFDPIEEFGWLNQVSASVIKLDPHLLLGRILQLAIVSLAKVITVMEEDVEACQQVEASLSAVASDQLRFTLALLDRLRTYVNDNLMICRAHFNTRLHRPKHTGAGSDVFDELKTDLEYMLARIESLRARCDTTTTTLLSTMSILESQKSIEQSRQVNKLTKLAFVYVPLSFVSSVFGMNVKEIQTNPPMWMFVVTAVAFILLSYFVASWKEIKSRLIRLLNS